MPFSPPPMGFDAAAALDEEVTERFFREMLRRSWSAPSVKAVLSSAPQLMLPGTDDYGIEAAAKRGLDFAAMSSSSTTTTSGSDGNVEEAEENNSRLAVQCSLRCLRLLRSVLESYRKLYWSFVLSQRRVTNLRSRIFAQTIRTSARAPRCDLSCLSFGGR